MIEWISTNGFWLALSLFLIGGVVSAFIDIRGRTPHTASLIAHIGAAAGSLVALFFGVTHFMSGTPFVVNIPISMSLASNILTLRIDVLSALFISIISFVSLAASIFGIGYQKQFYGIYRVGFFGCLFNIFIASMLVVVSANHAFLFLAAWEIMAVSSYGLVVFENRHKENIKAGTLYILMTQFGTVFLFAAFIFLHHFAGSWDFDAFRTAAPSIPPIMQNVILALALVGFATKAGVIPLHIWLPEAHPAAPSHVSAIMSGVMIKTAIFMIIRFFFDFVPVPTIYWGLILLGLGAVSSILGVLYALSEHDIKRLLAYHSVENIGIILLGVGASLVFFVSGIPTLGIIALAAALYHTLNHALFKALLFLSAGSVVHATGTRNMEEYGGLIKLMPWTAFFFLIGAVAISGLPPFNGFVSEWLTFQSLFAGIASLSLTAKLVFLAGAASLSFTGGLAAACFVKAFGVTFLARPRSHEAREAHESESSMQFGMVLLSIAIVMCGIFASTVAPILAYAAANLVGIPSAVPVVSPFTGLAISGVASLSMIIIAAMLALAILVTFIMTSFFGRKQKEVIARTWDCGADLSPRMEITSTGFARSLMVMFRDVLRPMKNVSTEHDPETARYFESSRTVELGLHDVYDSYLYRPAMRTIDYISHHTRKIQSGDLNLYLLYMFLTTIILLVIALHV